jgi:hypothetical protein
VLISSYRLRLLVGLIGSLSLTVGTLGIGWLAPASVLRSWVFFDVLRNSRGAVAVSMALVVAGLLLLLVAWLALGLSLRGERTRRRVSALRQVAVSITAWSIPLLVSFPLFSRDIFAYLGQGRVMAAGLDPYLHGTAEVPGWFEVGVDPRWSTSPTPYGPVFVWLQKVIVVATTGLPSEVTLLVTRLVIVAGFAMLAYYAWRIARLRGLDEAAVLWAVAASPLVLMNFIVAGHNDALMLGFIAAGVYWALRDRPLLATVLVTVAIGVKPIALVALPVIGIIWAGSNARWGALILRWLAVAGIALGSIVAFGIGLGVGIGWVGALATPLTIGSWYSIPHELALGASALAQQFGHDGDHAASIVTTVFLVAGCAVAAYLFTVKRRADPLWILAGAFAALTLSSPLLHPWYGLWLICLFAMAGLGRAWQVRVLIYATAFFMVIGVRDRVDLIDRLRPDRLFIDGYQWSTIAGIVLVLTVFEIVVWRRFTSRGLLLPMLGRHDDVTVRSTPSP